MADYEFRYRLNSAPEARNDGSAQVAHDIDAVAEPVGDGGFFSVPGHHKTILVPAADMAVMLAMSNGAAKVTAYKPLLVANRNAQPMPFNTGWTLANLELFMDANDASAAAASGADEYITVDLGLTYPVTFSL